MAFVLPTFNLTAAVYRWNGSGYTFTLNVECNLALGRRVATIQTVAGPQTIEGLTPILLVPPLSDLRDISCMDHMDVVEVPAGSRRWYGVSLVDDIGKGFANEHRCATLFKVGWYNPWDTYGFTPWPAPIP